MVHETNPLNIPFAGLHLWRAMGARSILAIIIRALL
jgi:hypothetical protein